jgi:MFS family permease
MDLNVLNLAVPHLVADLRPSSAQLLWIVDIYGFVIAGSLITMGTLGDRIGRRRLLLSGPSSLLQRPSLPRSPSPRLCCLVRGRSFTAPPERAGMAAGLSETTTELGGALGIAILGSVITAIFAR